MSEPALHNDILPTAIDWAYCNGLAVKPKAPSEQSRAVHAPFSLFPSRYPKSCFDDAVALQPHFNHLVDLIARDPEFLEPIMHSLSESDDFIKRSFQIYKECKLEGSTQPIQFGVHRSDYLLHGSGNGSLKIQQVELNTIASSFAGLSTKVSGLHRFLRDRFGGAPFQAGELKENSAVQGIARGIARAWSLYGVADAIVIMVVQDGERNIFDQRCLELCLFENHGVKLIRKSLSQIAREGRIDDPKRRLMINDEEVAVVYYRAGYGPGDYSQEADWNARLMVERSHAIKCPNINYQLVGSKKVQQILAQPNVIERFLRDPQQISFVRSCFTGLFPLDESEEGLAAYAAALQNPDRYVMKPQREGGGNNFFGDDIVKELQRMTVRERNAYILMELIKGPAQKSIIVREGAAIIDETVSELGIYGVWISDGAVVHMNETSGYLLRTKSSKSHEGGVAAGYAVLDSPLLI